VGSRDPHTASPISPKSAYPGSGWWREESREITLEPGPHAARVSVLRYGTGIRRKLVLDWTEGTEGLLDETFRYLTALDNSAWGRPREGVAIRISTPLRNTSASAKAAAETLLLDFYRSIRPALDLVGFQPRADS